MTYEAFISIVLILLITTLVISLTIYTFRDNKQMIKNIINNVLKIPMPICIITVNNTIFTCNKAFRDLFDNYILDYNGYNITKIFENIDDFMSIKSEYTDNMCVEKIINIKQNKGSAKAKIKFFSLPIINKKYFVMTIVNLDDITKTLKYFSVFSSILEASPDGIIITKYVDNKNPPIILYTNNAINRITGYTKEELKNKPLTSIFQFNVNEKTLQEITDNINNLKQTSLEYQYINKSGEIYWCETEILPLENVDIRRSLIENNISADCEIIDDLLYSDIEIYITIHQQNITDKKNNEILLNKDIKYINTMLDKKNKLIDLLTNIIQENNINGIIEKFGNGIDADKISIFSKNYKNNKEYFKCIYEWCSNGIKSTLKNVNIDNNMLENLHAYSLYTNLIKNKPTKIYINNKYDDDDTGVITKSIFNNGIKSELIQPIFKGDQLLGFIGIHSYQENETWGKDIESVLSIIAYKIGKLM